MECVVCEREGGSDSKGVITLQSTSSGMVCPKCIDGLVEDALMRTSNVDGGYVKKNDWKSRSKQKMASRAYKKWTR